MRIRLLAPLVVLAVALAAVPALAAEPTTNTSDAQDVTATTAIVSGTVNPRGVPTTAYFEYGTTTAYGSRTPDQVVGADNGNKTVSATLAGLTPGTNSHVRIVATNADGASTGDDQTFTTPAASGPAPGPAPAGVPEPSKLELARATISRAERTVDVLAPITARASGRVNLELYAAGIRHRWTAAIDSAAGRIRTKVAIPAAQANLGTGILTIAYAGDPDTRPQTVRLRAANRPANLTEVRPTIADNRLRASGTVSTRARGVVRVQLEYFSGGATTTLEKFAQIDDGRWSLNYRLTDQERQAIADRRGTLHSYILFTGSLPAELRGEMESYQVLGAP